VSILVASTLVAYGGTPRNGGLAIAAQYRLSATDGKIVTTESFKGQWQLVFFGFTQCPDACPTALLSVKLAMAALGPLAARVQPIFITLDPQRDSAEVLASYLRAYGVNVIGLRGNPAEVQAAERSFRVYVQSRPLANDSYTVDHSAFLYLLNPDGQFVKLLSGDVPGHKLAAELRDVIG
jgi:protein SCO1/2